jgi:hypothetical protein
MSQPQIDWFEAVTAIVAVLGLLLSIYNFYAERKDKKRQVEVRLVVGILGRETGTPTPPSLIIGVTNTGFRTVHITLAGIILPNKERVSLVVGPDAAMSYPQELTEGESRTFLMPLREVSELLRKHGLSGKVKLRGFCTDTLQKEYTSKLLRFNMEEPTKV